MFLRNMRNSLLVLITFDGIFGKPFLNEIFFSMCSYFVSTPVANKSIFFHCVGKVIDNNDDAALLEEREELVERQDLGL